MFPTVRCMSCNEHGTDGRCRSPKVFCIAGVPTEEREEKNQVKLTRPEARVLERRIAWR